MGGMGGGMGGPPMGGMPGMGGPPQQPMKLKTYDVWDVLQGLLTGQPIKDDKVGPKPKTQAPPGGGMMPPMGAPPMGDPMGGMGGMAPPPGGAPPMGGPPMPGM